ncbi:MAG TPA: uracil-DNA glycosylase [Aquiluna sp.]
MFRALHPDWQNLLGDQKQALETIESLIDSDPKTIPQKDLVLRVLRYPPSHYRVLIVGQDPYPNPLHANGLAFAVNPGTNPLPPTLANIFKELRSDLGHEFVQTGDINPWQERGVLLLNRHLTTRSDETAAHFAFGWEEFTQRVVQELVRARSGKLVAILWGQRAQELAPDLAGAKVLTSPHPSPLSSYRGFFGSKPFSSCNNALVALDLEPIDWSA